MLVLGQNTINWKEVILKYFGEKYKKRVMGRARLGVWD